MFIFSFSDCYLDDLEQSLSLYEALSLIKNAHCKCVHSCINAGSESQGADKDHSTMNRTTCNDYIDPFQKSVKF